MLCLSGSVCRLVTLFIESGVCIAVKNVVERIIGATGETMILGNDEVGEGADEYVLGRLGVVRTKAVEPLTISGNDKQSDISRAIGHYRRDERRAPVGSKLPEDN